MEILSVSSVFKQIRNTTVLREVSLTQRKGERIAIAGETGAGKSTLLRIIGGFVQPDSGIVLFEDSRVLGPEDQLIPGHKGIAYLSQHFELRNNYRVEEILEYANLLASAEAAALYEVCRISHLLKRKTDQLSGGERQRIALARLLSNRPRLLLLDEPFSNLDIIHKTVLQQVIEDIGAWLGITCMMVSHDPLDMLPWADRIIVLKNGTVEQQGSPGNIYRKPISEYVAGLFGHYNALSSTLAARAGCDIKATERLFLRPEAILMVPARETPLKGSVKSTSFFGSHYEHKMDLAGEDILVRGDRTLEVGEIIGIKLNIFDAWTISRP